MPHSLLHGLSVGRVDPQKDAVGALFPRGRGGCLAAEVGVDVLPGSGLQWLARVRLEAAFPQLPALDLACKDLDGA